MSEEKQYAERDLMAMDIAGNHYCRHIDHMTREKLHSKSDIAAELGWRDMQIAELKAQRDALAENEGYMQAFYEMAEILGIGARADSPKNVFEQVMKPMLINLQKQRDALAAENAAIMAALPEERFIDIMNENMDDVSLAEDIGYNTAVKEMRRDIKTPATDTYLNSVRDEALPAEVAEIIDSGDLESILFVSDAPFSEQYRMVLYKFRQLRAGEPS